MIWALVFILNVGDIRPIGYFDTYEHCLEQQERTIKGRLSAKDWVCVQVKQP